jgi:hypothetical protein
MFTKLYETSKFCQLIMQNTHLLKMPLTLQCKIETKFSPQNKINPSKYMVDLIPCVDI